MWDPHKEIQSLVDTFVADLSDLARRIAIEQIKVAFGTGAKLAASHAASHPVAVVTPRASRARRGQREIEALRGKVLAVIAERPGRRAEEINTTLGTKTPEIAQLLRRLVADQLVRTEGARRGTRYFATAQVDVANVRRPEPAATVEEPAH